MKEKVMIFCTLALLLSSCIHHKKLQLTFPDVPTRILVPQDTISFAPINESSALIKSRQYKNVYWTLNDSGDEARIFPITATGEIIRPHWYENFQGIKIPDAVNIDWEDLAIDNNGHLYIGACGNNGNTRKDLAIYIIAEPVPDNTVATRIQQQVPFYYPEQKAFPPEKKNFDCEAQFWSKGHLYLLTKHRADDHTCLYRFNRLTPPYPIKVEKIAEFPIQGMVTAADASPDGKHLAILTYNAVWLFTAKGTSDNYFAGTIHWLPISAKQCEGICIDNEYLRITNEQREIFVLPQKDLYPVHRKK